ncbi:MAG: pyridine nucleotide-disulfide oxidoreductase [Nocardioidaceae bacterium]|nr:pyridine nucleotide-disulfide oxidoreductase [Nocardioidaceae bacterium]
MPSSGVVVVGAGIAAVSVARRLRALGYGGDLAMVTDDSAPPYDRPPLSKQFLAGTLGRDQVGLLQSGEPETLAVRTIAGTATTLDRGARQVVLDDGTRVPYRLLVVATGARARRLPYPDLDGVHHLRTLDDAERLAADLRPGSQLVVIGGGFIGLEVAATAYALGAHVTVLETATQPLTRVLGPVAGGMVAALHEDRARLRFGVTVSGLVGDVRVRGVVVDGDEIPADAVVVGVGAVPNTEWLADSGLDVTNGVLCDDSGRTDDPAVYAVGDVSRWVHGVSGRADRVEQWQTAVEQAAVVAANVAVDLAVDGAGAERWCSVPYFWSDQYEHKVQFCGSAGPVIRDRDVRRGRVACFADAEDDVLTGVLAVDNPAALARGRRLVAAGTSWSDAVTWLDTL